MFEIATDVTVGANFVVLLIVKLNVNNELIGTAHTYLPDNRKLLSKLILPLE